MGLFNYTVAGGGFILIGAWESLVSTSDALKNSSPPSTSQNPSTDKHTQDSIFSSSITFILIFILSFLFILNSLLSFFDALNSKDNIGSVLQLQNGISRAHMRYRPIGAEMQHLEMDSQAHFTLDSDEEDNENGIKEEMSVEMQKAIMPVPESETNGYHTRP
ncbi:hypothetical protein K7X08_019234 [Anisodus acutangulus]|uniref:Uncharacterized protein n=1 Tax=Anisodus acutangulus TaxID=402998 RepID=A0A9Q1MS22_9SOLA|nr:hypothetical protein K7X08_019234 [Anisodus acutangulus]